MADANEVQVGGDHYKRQSELGRPQHWDLVALYEWDYFQGQVTKYLMRWKYKWPTPEKRLEDLRKARHFLDKYIQLEEAKLAPQEQIRAATAEEVEIGSNAFWQNEGYYGDNTQLYTCRHCKSRWRVSGTPTYPHPACAPHFVGGPEALERAVACGLYPVAPAKAG